MGLPGRWSPWVWAQRRGAGAQAWSLVGLMEAGGGEGPGGLRVKVPAPTAVVRSRKGRRGVSEVGPGSRLALGTKPPASCPCQREERVLCSPMPGRHRHSP